MGEEVGRYQYVGSELELFANAINWKSYFSDRIRPFLGRRVLEVGAGLGGTTRILCSGSHDSWTCLEPDPKMAAALKSRIAAGELPAFCRIVTGTLPTPLLFHASFDTVLYIDVLEHIEKDRQEMEQAVQYLEPDGHLIVLSPAHNWLFSPFDDALGHFRRYSKKTLRALTPDATQLVGIEYLDSVGLLASAANRLLLRQREPTQGQISFWDQRMVPISRRLDPLTRFSVGKSIFATWKKLHGMA